MRVLRVDALKRLVEVVPETTLDLLNVFRLVSVGDTLYSETSREVKKERADGSYDSERVRLRIGVEVEKKTLEPMMRRIAFLGRIVYESRDLGLEGKYHSIHLSPGTPITIESRQNFQRLNAFAKHYKRYEKLVGGDLLVVLVDDEGISVIQIGRLGMKALFEKRLVAAGKREPEERLRAVAMLYSGAANVLEKRVEEDESSEILVFGPSIFVDDFLQYLKRNKRGLLSRVRRTGYVSEGASSGIGELLRNRVLHEYGERVKVVADAEAVEELIAAMARDPASVAVGLRECLRAVELGAVSRLLVDEAFLWEHLTESDVERLLDMAEQSGAAVQVIASGYEAADKIAALGGVAATLRYPLPPATQNK